MRVKQLRRERISARRIWFRCARVCVCVCCSGQESKKAVASRSRNSIDGTPDQTISGTNRARTEENRCVVSCGIDRRSQSCYLRKRVHRFSTRQSTQFLSNNLDQDHRAREGLLSIRAVDYPTRQLTQKKDDENIKIWPRYVTQEAREKRAGKCTTSKSHPQSG